MPDYKDAVDIVKQERKRLMDEKDRINNKLETISIIMAKLEDKGLNK
jgi:hypothetical protein